MFQLFKISILNFKTKCFSNYFHLKVGSFLWDTLYKNVLPKFQMTVYTDLLLGMMIVQALSIHRLYSVDDYAKKWRTRSGLNFM